MAAGMPGTAQNGGLGSIPNLNLDSHNQLLGSLGIGQNNALSSILGGQSDTTQQSSGLGNLQLPGQTNNNLSYLLQGNETTNQVQ